MSLKYRPSVLLPIKIHVWCCNITCPKMERHNKTAMITPKTELFLPKLGPSEPFLRWKWYNTHIFIAKRVMILQVRQFSVISKILDSVFRILVFWDIEIYTISLPSLIKHNNMAKHRRDSELPSIFAQCGRIQAWIWALYLLFHVHVSLTW